MSETKQKTEQPTEQPQTAVVVPFNPFQHLSAEAIAALANRYNKQWRGAHAVDIALAMTEFGCSENEAMFYADLKASAESILDAAEVTKAADYISNLLSGVAFPSSAEVTLGLIQTRYEALKPALRKTCGTRVRDKAHSKYQSETAKAILSKVYAILGVTEKDWMR